jgi:ArsR family transcriptional regulator
MQQTHRKPKSQSPDADRMFRAMADRTRLRILSLLQRSGDTAVCVCHLVDAVELPQPTVSRHLAYLRRSKLVTVRKEGLWCYYTLARPRNAFHAKLLECLGTCCTNVPELARDAARLKKSSPPCCA